jgi:hypothetical protein
MSDHPVTVAVQGWTWSAGLLATLNAVVIGVAVAFVKAWPALKKIANDREKTALEARGADMVKMNERVAALEARVETASQAAHSAEMKLVYAVNAVQLLAAPIRAANPNDPTLLQAMELLAAATVGGMPGWAPKISAELTKIKGVGE